MKSTYAAPTASTTGNVVRTTLGSKPVFNESMDLTTRPSGGSGLSFGL
jgi:hypothetical protein